MLKQKVFPAIVIYAILTSTLWSEVTISSNSLFTAPTEVKFSSTDISLLNFNFYNPESENRFVESLEFEVSSGNALDVTDLILMQGTINLNELYNGALNVESSGNLKLSFSPAFQFAPGDNLNFDVLASIGATTDSDNHREQRGATVTSGTRSSGLLTGISYTHKGSTQTVS